MVLSTAHSVVGETMNTRARRALSAMSLAPA